MTINYQALLDQFNKNYDFLYNAKAYVAGYNEALDYFDNTVRKNTALSDILCKFVEFRSDILSSDRECVAFVFSLEDLGILDSLNL